MKRKIERITVDGETKYRVYVKENIFSKWKRNVFVCEETGEEWSDLTALQLFHVQNDFYWDIPKDIRDEIWHAHNIAEIEEHKENLYRIEKWKDPEHNRFVETVCGAKTIGELSDGEHTFDEYKTLLNSKWIKCSEKLPDKEGTYLFWNNAKNKWSGKILGAEMVYYRGVEWFKEINHTYKHINPIDSHMLDYVAWMSIPKFEEE